MALSHAVARCLGIALLLGGIHACVMPTQAQLAPSQPIKIIVGVPAGGFGDLAARVLAQRLSENGHAVVVENRLGGNGLVATEAVAKSRADGYTLVMGNHSTLGTLPHLTKVGYDPLKDLQPITLMLTVPNVLVVKPALPAASMPELIAYGKTSRLTNATQGIGASSPSSASSSSSSPASTSPTCTIAARRPRCGTSSPATST
jgi:tripartite-type tricarboxylate transporter receptor subunit TctC